MECEHHLLIIHTMQVIHGPCAHFYVNNMKEIFKQYILCAHNCCSGNVLICIYLLLSLIFYLCLYLYISNYGNNLIYKEMYTETNYYRRFSRKIFCFDVMSKHALIL